MKISKKTKLISSLSVVIILLIVAIVVFTKHNSKQQNNVVATINGENIYQADIDEKLTKMFKGQNQKIAIDNFPKQVVESLIKEIYLQRELAKIAGKSPIAKSKQVKKQISDYKNSIIIQAYLADIISKKVTDKTIKDRYSQLSTELSGKKEMHIKHILVENIDLAKKIISEIKGKKSSFEKLAKQHSKDTANAALGGDLGYIIPDDLDENFAIALSSLENNQISEPIKTNFGWHIVKLENTRDVEVPSFENAKASIENQLKQDAVEEIFNKITKDSQIKILIPLKEADEQPKENAVPTESSTPEPKSDEIKK